MADHYTEFSCTLPLGAASHVEAALVLYRQFAAEREAAGEDLGFHAQPDYTVRGEASGLRLRDAAGDGDPEQVIAFVQRCAAAFNLSGRWGFSWSDHSSHHRPDGFGGGAHVLDLGRRETVAWLGCVEWLALELAAEPTRGGAPRAEPLLQHVAGLEGWTVATQAGVLLDFIDALIADTPEVAERLRAHLAGAAASSADRMTCRECGEPMLVAGGGISHHAGDGPDGINHDADRDHVRFVRRPRSPYTVTDRKRAAAVRRQRREREAAPLLAPLIAERQPDVETLMRERVECWTGAEQAWRDRRATTSPVAPIVSRTACSTTYGHSFAPASPRRSPPSAFGVRRLLLPRPRRRRPDRGRPGAESPAASRSPSHYGDSSGSKRQ